MFRKYFYSNFILKNSARLARPICANQLDITTEYHSISESNPQFP